MQEKVKQLPPKVWELQKQIQPASNIAFAILEAYY